MERSGGLESFFFSITEAVEAAPDYGVRHPPDDFQRCRVDDVDRGGCLGAHEFAVDVEREGIHGQTATIWARSNRCKVAFMSGGVARATYDDVRLIVQLYDLRREERLRQARAWFAASFRVTTWDEFVALCPPGSETNASYRMVVTYWEMVASFLTTGVLSAELFYQSGRELLFVWERLRDFVPQLRAQYGNPVEYRNLEAAAAAYIEWWNKQAPGAYDAFSKRVRGPSAGSGSSRAV